MKKNQKVTTELTQNEKKLLGKCLRMHEWHFEELFTDSCSLISSDVIGWEKEINDVYDDSKEPTRAVTVCVYGLNSVNSLSKKPVIANFFIHYSCRVYQEWHIEKAIKIKELITKEFLIKQQKEKERISRIKRNLMSIKAA